jgi:hypothetical protein
MGGLSENWPTVTGTQSDMSVARRRDRLPVRRRWPYTWEWLIWLAGATVVVAGAGLLRLGTN